MATMAHQQRCQPGDHNPTNKKSATTTPKTTTTTVNSVNSDDDIAAIAKQISDTAEVIYQNWKSRNLAPADLISCHSVDNDTAANMLGSMLKPSTSIDILTHAPEMDTNRLETFVKTFVNEDKARLAAASANNRIRKNNGSSIQFALEKFEKKNLGNGPLEKINNKNKVNVNRKPEILPKPITTTTPTTLLRHPPQLAETIEMTLPADLHHHHHQTWPLKNRLINNNSNKKIIDEVALEEKRLINALTKIDNNIHHNAVPHPELTLTQRQHLRQSAANPIRPFLTRGSVAERVLIFERCPSDVVRVRTNINNNNQQKKVVRPPPQHTTLQRHVRTHRHLNIPKFYYPMGKPDGATAASTTEIPEKLASIFTKCRRQSRADFAQIVHICQLPLYWKVPLFLCVTQNNVNCHADEFATFWRSLTGDCHDLASKFVYILSRGQRHFLLPEDFIPLIQDVVDTHPGLTFLKEATEFHSRYVHTVIARIFYTVNRSWSGKITKNELRKSNLLAVIQQLEFEDDINQVTQYFSYEHFYVIYCKFWELDRDHDLFIDRHDLIRHNDHALSTRIIDRIFSGCVTRRQSKDAQQQLQLLRMSYTDFVWFLLSEEDKQTATSIEYWFRCMDVDGDGYLSMYELEYFYDEQMERMENVGIEILPFQDCLCQMLDMVKPRCEGKISLGDLKRCKMTAVFFDTFFNLEKYLDHEQRDPFVVASQKDFDGLELSDWDRYAAEEYELLVAEEGGGNDHLVEDSLSSNEEEEEEEENEEIKMLEHDDEIS